MADIDGLVQEAENIIKEYSVNRQKLQDLHDRIGLILSGTPIPENKKEPEQLERTIDVVRNKVVEVLRQGALARGEIVQRTQLPLNLIVRAIRQLANEGKIVSRGKKRNSRWHIKK